VSNAMNKRILVVSRDAKTREALVRILASAGYAVEPTDSAVRAREIATAGDVALAILAPAPFGNGGPELARDMAEAIGRLVVVAEQPAALDRWSGLGIKIDACITEPFAAPELLAQVATILERDESGRGETVDERALLTFEGFTLDIGGHSLINASGQEVPLSRAEFALLATFARSSGRVLSRDRLLGSVTHNPDDVYDRSVDVMVWRLRHKIEHNPKQPRLIVTVPGAGYKFATKVRSSRAAAETTAEAAAEGQPVLPMQTSALRRHDASDCRLPVERRHITVLACGLVGLDALLSQLDAEEIKAVIGTYRRECSEVVAQFGSFVTKFSGDRIRFYFGYPEAHEHDAEWAVRAGIAIIDVVAALAARTAVNLRVRVGIASGLVVVGDLGSGATTEIIGELPSLAASLNSLAPPNAVLIATSTRDLVGGLFRYKQIGPITVPEIPEPVAAWQVVGEGAVESRFDALRASELSPMVGRQEEMELLLRRWRQSEKGDGRVVLICGEPGIGKSRLAKWFAERVESEPHARLSYQCSPYHRTSALYPVVAQIARAAGFEMEDPPERRLDKLDEMITIAGVDRTDAAPLLAALLSIPATGRYQPLALTPAQRRGQTLSVLLELVAGLAGQRPVLLIFEDVHWADATSLEWLDLAINLARRMPIMMIITYRLEFKPPWSGLPGVSTLMLGRLEPRDVRAMIKGILRVGRLEASIVDRIVDQTDGIPLYVEELTKAVVHADPAPHGADPNTASSSFAIPLTLRHSLMARVDRLGSARAVAQIGAAVGREFSYVLVQQLAALDESALSRALEDLEKSELVFRHGAAPDATYSFTHVLVQEAAYETLPKSRRRALHQRIAELLCDLANSSDNPEPEAVAHHFTQAGLNEAAAQWWGKAGDRALGKSAYIEAISNFDKALRLAQGAVAGQRQRRLLLRLQIGYGQALIASRGHGAPETTAAFARARELAAGIENGSERLSALYGMWSGSFCRAELVPMGDLAERIAQEVENSPELNDMRVVADRLLGVTAWFRGDYLRARLHLERAVEAYDTDRHAALALRFGQDVGVCAMVYLALVLWTVGKTRAAHRQIDAARALALQSGHVPTIAYMRVHECALACISADPRAALPLAQAVVDISRQHGLPLWLVGGTFCLGWSQWHAGDRETGLAHMREAMELCREQGAIFMPNYAFLRAEAEALSGELETGLALVVDQLAEIERSGQRWLEAELHRRYAELLLQCVPADEAAAEGAFNRALEVARAQHAKVFELRAAMGLARLYQSQSRIDAARDVLVPTSGAWSENPDLPEVREARRILLLLA
jgi:DNA-binding response OmpR family regulator/class 3 adenylate cyclase/predicted ATPase